MNTHPSQFQPFQRLTPPTNWSIAPKLFFHQRCARLLETLPALQHDPNRLEDVLKVDAADCLRYLVATKSHTVAQRKLGGL